jgi:hypothetical protein
VSDNLSFFNSWAAQGMAPFSVQVMITTTTLQSGPHFLFDTTQILHPTDGGQYYTDDERSGQMNKVSAIYSSPTEP